MHVRGIVTDMLSRWTTVRIVVEQQPASACSTVVFSLNCNHVSPSEANFAALHGVGLLQLWRTLLVGCTAAGRC